MGLKRAAAVSGRQENIKREKQKKIERGAEREGREREETTWCVIGYDIMM